MKLTNKASGESHALTQQVFTVGSGHVNNLVLPGEQIRKIHFQIRRQDGEFRLIAMNGTVEVNGAAVAEHLLAPGDEVRLGPYNLVFERPAPAAAGPAAPAAAWAGSADAMLLDSVIRLLENPDKRASSEEILSLGLELMRADGGYLFMVEDGQLQLFHSIPEDNANYSNSAVQAAFKGKDTVVWSASDAHGEVSAQSLEQKNIYSIMVAPLFQPGQGAIAGLLYLHRRKDERPFSEEERDLFSKVSRVLGAVLAGNRAQMEQAEQLESLKGLKASGDLIYSSREMVKVVEMAKRAAGSNVPVLVTGETGTGKDVLANFIHRHSPRASRPFVAVNCGAIPEHLFESELFGHEKGSFTGATAQQKGLFEQAHGGTLFLDEIGELPQLMQVKFLRALQTGRVRRVGGAEEIAVDARVVAATNRDLPALIREGRFREDLYYRLNLVQLHLPPLRDREGDVLFLANHILKKACANFNMNSAALTKAAEKALLKYGWPGNIRELENKIQKALLNARSRVIDVDCLELPEEPAAELATLKAVREAAESRAIHMALTKARGNLTLAASFLGIDRKVLRDIMERLSINKLDFKTAREP